MQEIIIIRITIPHISTIICTKYRMACKLKLSFQSRIAGVVADNALRDCERALSQSMRIGASTNLSVCEIANQDIFNFPTDKDVPFWRLTHHCKG